MIVIGESGACDVIIRSVCTSQEHSGVHEHLPMIPQLQRTVHAASHQKITVSAEATSGRYHAPTIATFGLNAMRMGSDSPLLYEVLDSAGIPQSQSTIIRAGEELLPEAWIPAACVQHVCMTFGT